MPFSRVEMSTAILYEIYSNAASTDQGLSEHPALMDLADTLAARAINARFIKLVHHETDEINLAQGQFGQGVQVKGTAQKAFRPEIHLRGCVSWLRSLMGRSTHAMHLELSQIRATNGAPLVMEGIAKYKLRIFVTGIDQEQFDRLLLKPDLSLAEIPAGLSEKPAIQEEYLARQQRATGFFKQMQHVSEAGLLTPDQAKALSEMGRTRDSSQVSKLNPAQVVNIGLISEYLERYQSLFDQFFALLRYAEAGSELAPLFELLVQGFPTGALRQNLESFTLENRRDRIADKRSLVNAVRIGLAASNESRRIEFQDQFRALVMKRRMVVDPALYRHAVLLSAADPDDMAVVSPIRRIFTGLKAALNDMGAAAGDSESQVSPEVKRLFFEMVITLTFDAQFTSRIDEARQPHRVLRAREMLPLLRLQVFNIAGLQKLNPKVPISGVAMNLAQKIPIAKVELEAVLQRFGQALTPLGQMADALAGYLRARVKEDARAQAARAVRKYLTRAYALLGLTNYVLGRARLTSLEWSALRAAGRCLGLPIVTSRDQIRNEKALAQIRQGDQENLEGYVLLLNREDTEIFPTRTDPVALATAYRHLFESQIVRTVRRFMYQRLQVLFGQHGSKLFEVLYNRVTVEAELRLSRNQLAIVLLRHRVFEKTRLAEIGYRPRTMENGEDGANPWLLPPEAGSLTETGEHPFSPAKIAKAYEEAMTAFGEMIRAYAPKPQTAQAEGMWDIAAVLGSLCEDEIYDLHDQNAREPLAKSKAAAVLWKLIQETISKNFKTITSGRETEGEAIRFVLPGDLAYLALLKPEHAFKIGEETLTFQLLAARASTLDELDAASRIVAAALDREIGDGAQGQTILLRQAREALARHSEQWETLRHLSMLPLTDQLLAETLIKLVKPDRPNAKDVATFPEEVVLYASVSSSDQAKFHKMAPPSAKLNQYATLSEMAGWLARFPRLQEEMEGYRDLIADVIAAIARMNITVWEAPYLIKYREGLENLDEALTISPEHIDRESLRKMEHLARTVGTMVRDIHLQERSLRQRDRWLNRISSRFRATQPNHRLNFVDLLHEGSASAPTQEEGKEKARAKEKEYQTFSERVRNVIETRERLADKEIFVLSPANSQRNLTLALVDRLFALKGLFTPILIDVSNCESFVDALQSRIPPHRMFNLNEM